MAGETKERILNTALALFSQRGYLGTSMSDIANELGMTKGALYKHYTSKQEILDRITARMGELDQERAQAYQMPDAEPDGFAEAYRNTPAEKIRTYSVAQFRHWTEDGFSARFRKLLTLEQYRDPAFAALYQNYLASGPVPYHDGFQRERHATGPRILRAHIPALQHLRRHRRQRSSHSAAANTH